MTLSASHAKVAAPLFNGLDIAAFEAGDVDPAAFSHEAHIFIAWSYLQETDLPEAIRRFTAALRRLTVKLGVPGKYHETITWFFLMLIAERCRPAPSGDWSDFKSENSDLINDAKGLLSQYYTRRCLKSDLARTQFILPDRVTTTQGASTN